MEGIDRESAGAVRLGMSVSKAQNESENVGYREK